MGSLENGGAPPKRTGTTAAAGVGRTFLHKPRSRLARFLISEKVDYFQWICTIAAFFFVVILFQAFLPGSLEKSSAGELRLPEGLDRELFEHIGELDFGEGIRFAPFKVLEKFQREKRKVANASLLLGRQLTRFALRRPQLALVLPDLEADSMQLQMVTVAAALQEIGYDIQLFTLEDGPAHTVWRNLGVPISILPINQKTEIAVDWLSFQGVLISSIAARPVFSSLMQEPFKSIPVVWTIQERSLAIRQNHYARNSQIQLISEWKQVFSRATVVVFPTHLLPMMYSPFDAGNYLVIPGSFAEAWEASAVVSSFNELDFRLKMGYNSEHLVISIVSSQFSYSGMLLEHALILHALRPLVQEQISNESAYSQMKILILSENSNDTFKNTIETISQRFGYPKGTVEHIFVGGDSSNFLSITDLVIYGSFLEEPSFPPLLLQAMCLGKLVIAPDLDIIKKYIADKVNGFLFPKENVHILLKVVLQTISNGKVLPLAQNVASVGRVQAKSLMVSEAIEGYATLLEYILDFPSEVASPKPVTEIPARLKEGWQWTLFKDINSDSLNRTRRSYKILEKLEDRWNHTYHGSPAAYLTRLDEAFSPIAWAEEKVIEMANTKKRLEEEELKDRTEQSHGTWEEVYRNAKRADRAKNELHERDERELERTGQPLCIYEPYYGEGVWPFLHNSSLYRGIGLSTRGRRPGADDIDASSRLPLLNNVYYRDVLGEFGAFFALANRVDRIHKNAWIGFQSWKATGQKVSLSKKAERVLLEAIQSRRYGDTLYFWVRMDKDPRNALQQDFWPFCDAINAGNCRLAVSESLQRMYSIKDGWNSLPPMPRDGDTWSVMHCWALPSKSFLEFVMFSRMFIDALDAQMYDEHHDTKHCYLSLSKDRHCYYRVLELLINVWAYHSARRMVYVNPETGAMQEQHRFKSRRGHMWIKWFSFSTLKSMDEELAEEADTDHPDRRWLWPSTGEVFWQGVYDRERNIRHQQKERRRQQSKDKIKRIKNRQRQKTLGKYIKPPPDDAAGSNRTLTL